MGFQSKSKKIVVLDLDNTLVHAESVCSLCGGREARGYLLGQPAHYRRVRCRHHVLGSLPIVVNLRPGTTWFLRKLQERNLDVIVFSAGTEDYVREVTALVFGRNGISPLLVLDRRYLGPIWPFKSMSTVECMLDVVGYTDNHRCVTVDDNPDNFAGNARRIVIRPWTCREQDDKELVEVLRCIDKL